MVLTLLIALCWTPQTQAAVANNVAEFTIDPVYPSEQQTGDTGYFSLAVTPASTVPVKVKITNTNQQSRDLPPQGRQRHHQSWWDN